MPTKGYLASITETLLQDSTLPQDVGIQRCRKGRSATSIENTMVGVDDILPYVGECGLYQYTQAAFLCVMNVAITFSGLYLASFGVFMEMSPKQYRVQLKRYLFSLTLSL